MDNGVGEAGGDEREPARPRAAAPTSGTSWMTFRLTCAKMQQLLYGLGEKLVKSTRWNHRRGEGCEGDRAAGRGREGGPGSPC